MRTTMNVFPLLLHALNLALGRPITPSIGLTIPALQRNRLHGSLYNSSLSDFYETRAIVGKVPAECLEKIVDGRTEYSATLLETTIDKVSALGVEGSLKLAILSGLVKIDGEGSYNWEDGAKENQVEAVITARIHTQEEVLDINCRELSPHFVTRILNSTDANYMTTSITYGFGYTVRIKVSSKEAKEDTKIKGSIGGELSMLASAVTAAIKGTGNYQDFKLNSSHDFTYSIDGDVNLASHKFKSLDDLMFFINAANMELTTRKGRERGRALSYGLTHINDVFAASGVDRVMNSTSGLKPASSEEALGAIRVAELVFKDAIAIQRKAIAHRNCVPSNYIMALADSVHTHKLGFSFFKQNLSKAVVNESLGSLSVDKTVQDYFSSAFSPRTFQSDLIKNFTHFNDMLRTLERLESKNIPCLPFDISRKDFPLLYGQQTVAILQFNTSQIDSNLDIWASLVNNLTKACSRTTGSAENIVCFHVDCDLSAHMCSNATIPTILYVENGFIRDGRATEVTKTRDDKLEEAKDILQNKTHDDEVVAYRESSDSEMEADREKGVGHVEADRESGDGELEADKESGDGKGEAERESGDGKGEAERESESGKVEAERESENGKVDADREIEDGETEADKESGVRKVGTDRENGDGEVGVDRENGDDEMGADRGSGDGEMEADSLNEDNMTEKDLTKDLILKLIDNNFKFD